MYSLNGSLNLETESPRITENQAAVQKDLHKLSVHVRNHNMMYETINLKDAINVTLSSITGCNTNQFLPTFHIMA